MHRFRVRRVFLLNTPEFETLVNRDMAGGLGFDRRESTVLPPLDLLIYATHLAANEIAVELLDSQVTEQTPENIIQSICRFEPDVVLLTVSLPTMDADIPFARKLRKVLPERCKIVFKTGIRFKPALEKILTESDCDFCLTGECDLTIDDVLNETSSAGTARFKNGKFCLENEILLTDLDRLPVPNRSFLEKQKYIYSRFNSPATTIQTSRGCPFSCDYYCPYPLVQGKKWRAMTPDRILFELQSIVETHGITNVLFRDATFTLDKNRVRRLCEKTIKNDLRFKWWCETRIDRLDKELLDLMRQAGCAGINVGIESGDEGLLKDIAKQGLKVSDIVKITRHCKEIGIKLHYLLMVGLPDETRESLFETFKLIDETAPESIGITTVTPYPGTQMYADALANGWLVNSDFNTFGGHGLNMITESVSAKELKFAREKIFQLSQVAAVLSDKERTKRNHLFVEFESWCNEIKHSMSDRKL